MKKLLARAAAILAAAFLVAPGTVSATIVDLLTFESAVDAAQAVDPTLNGPPNDGKHDFAVGGFQGMNGNNVGFSAHSGPSGEDPSGHLSQTIPEGKTVAQRRDRFRVTCLEVLVNEAALGLTPANAETAQNFPNGRVLAVRDNGNPAGGQPVDQFAYYSGLPSNCAAVVGGAVFVPAHGNTWSTTSRRQQVARDPERENGCSGSRSLCLVEK